jgi:glucosylceramidase
VKTVLATLSGCSFALFVLACATEGEPGDDSSMAGSGGANVAGSTSTAGSGGRNTGGSTAAGSGGAPGSGGSAQAGSNGTAGSTPGSGGAGSGAGGASGGSAPQAGTGPIAGTGGTDPGAGGTDPGAGGTNPGAGGADPGAGGSVSPAGGSGGDSPVGGAAGMAGMPPEIDEPELVTSANNAWWQLGTLTEVTDGNAEVTVTDSMSQTWTGFGGTFNEKGWDALSALSAEDRDRALKLLFDRADGANLAFGRIPIGASDYAMNRYTLNDTAGDTAMNNFSLDRDREKLIPYIKAAKAVKGDIKFWGSPWTPPPWMKDNNAYDRGNMKSDTANLQAFALYLSKFVEEYTAEGIPIMAVHPQNEPGYQQDYPSCGWSGNLMATFIGTQLGPMFQERGITAEIFIGTMSNSQVDAGILTTVMNNATAKSFVKGYGLQWGMQDVYNNLGLDRNLQIWQTEHKAGNYPWESNYRSTAPNDLAYAQEGWGLLKDWIRKGVNSYSAWNMVLDHVGLSLDTVRPWAQNALLAVDKNAKRLIITPTYYVFRHLSQYVDPGAKLVGTNGGDALAFKNPDGTIVLVMYNSGGAKMTTVALGGKKFQFNMPGTGWATVNWK